jgi:hypothetical protein
MMKKIAIAVVLALVFATSGFAVNHLVVNAGAALNGTNFGLAVQHDGSANNVYVDSLHPTDESHYLIRFWIDPATLDLDPATAIRIAGIGDDVAGQHVVLLLRRDIATSPHQWLVNAWRKDDTGTFVFANSLFHSFIDAADKKRQYEFEWTAATAPGSNNGSFRMTRLNPTVVNKLNSNLDNDTLQVDNIRIGTLNGQGVSANSGEYHFDEFESYR